MRSVWLSAVLLASCARTPVEVVRPAPLGAAPLSSAAPAPSASARPTRCAAEPSTVYGNEAVLFVIDGEGTPAAQLPLELRDERGRSVSKGNVTLPGRWQVPDVPSGDFVLIVGDDALRCAVTVNRELQRAKAHPMTGMGSLEPSSREPSSPPPK